MDFVNKLIVGSFVVVIAAIALAIAIKPEPRDGSISRPLHRTAAEDRHIEKCESLATGYIRWRAANTVGSWVPIRTDNIQIATGGSEDSPYFVLSGTLHYRFDGDTKRSQFLCDDEEGKARVTFVSGILQGAQF